MEIPLNNDIALYEKVDRALSKMILSASGWRTVFAEGGEEDRGTGLSAAHTVIAAAAAKVFADYVKKAACTAREAHLEVPCIIVGMDTRPTGKAIADTMIKALLSEGCRVRFTAVAAAPEIMAYVRRGEAHGFVYISASHNPIGHNGLKFGRTDGGVLPGTDAKILIDAFRSFLSIPDCISKVYALLQNAPSLDEVHRDSPCAKADALSSYLDFTKEVVTGTGDKTKQDDLFKIIRNGIEKEPVHIVADFNGSARTLSIDKEILPNIGLNFSFINGEPGQIVHRIVPEGESLEPCVKFLEEMHGRDSSTVMGYVPDCDGDRGNLVIWDEKEGRARSLEAQEVFALACVSELTHLAWIGTFKNIAVAVNDPTSLRIVRIAAYFGAKVFRAEVGEANVVGLARKLREQGWIVRVLGEGSAGGNITHPSAVRDPIDTVFALLKMLTIRSGNGKKGFFELWCSLSGNKYHEDFSLADIIATLPQWISTSSYSEDALLSVKTEDHALLKDRYQKVFLREWEAKKDHLKTDYGIVDWTVACYNGTEEKKDIVRFSEAGRGGLKVCFTNSASIQIASIWMRGSGTEPVFRVMADAETETLERELIALQRAMVMEADGIRR
jgi:phosphoglucomutase